MNGGPLPWNGVVYKDLYGPNAAPWVVFTDGAAHCYWHIKNEGSVTKATTFNSAKKIFSSDTGEAIGVMRMLSFEHPDSDGASPEFGHWIMHEYSLNESTNGVAADLVVCKITRSVKNNSGRRSRRQPPRPLFSSPVIANGGISESIQIPASKRAAEECSFQERKVQKLCGDGFAAEAKPPPPHYSSPAIACVGGVTTSWQEEKPGDGVSTFSEVAAPTLVEALQQDENTEPPYGGSAEAAAIAEDDDYWPVKALLQDGNTEPPYGGTAEADEGIDELLRGSSGGGCDTAEGAAFPEGELDESSWRSDFNDFDIGFDVDSLLDDPLQVSPPSPHDYDFNIDVDSRFDDAAQVEPPSLWSYRL